MNKLRLFLFLLLTQLCLGQQIVKIPDAKLLFVGWSGGIVLQKPDGNYQLEIYESGGKLDIQYNKITAGQLEHSKANPTNIYKDEIKKGFSFKELQNLKFSCYDEDGDEDYYFLYNDFLLASFTNRKEEDQYYLRLNDISPYVVIEINKLKFIYYPDDRICIIPTQKGIRTVVITSYKDETIFKAEKHTITAEEATICSTKIRAQENYVEPEPSNQKCRLTNLFGKIEIAKKYDSIFLKNIVVCYSDKKVDLYNYQYKKFNQKPVKAFRVYENAVQFIENNELIDVDFNGTPTTQKYFQKFEGPYMPDGTQIYTYTIKKEDDGFYLYVGWTQQEKKKLIKTEAIESLFFPNNKSEEFYGNFSAWPACPVYFRLKDGSYGIGSLEQFIDPEYVDNEGYYANYQNLQYAKACFNSSLAKYKLKKNNLLLFYPMQKEFRYKVLEDFHGNFARFELPNGKKGWLNLGGKEYLDE